jgi:hypothetical protein
MTLGLYSAIAFGFWVLSLSLIVALNRRKCCPDYDVDCLLWSVAMAIFWPVTVCSVIFVGIITVVIALAIRLAGVWGRFL